MFPEYRLTTSNELELILYLYEENMHSPIQTTSPPFYVSGSVMQLVLILFCNSRSLPDVDADLLHNDQALSEHAQQNMMNSIVACSVGGLILLFLRNQYFTQDNGQKFGCFYICNAMLAATIAISACLDNLTAYSTLLISLVGATLYFTLSKLYLKLEIDDPLESSIIFGWMTVYSLLVVGFTHEDGLFTTGSFAQA
jgi:hypothetical protein